MRPKNFIFIAAMLLSLPTSADATMSWYLNPANPAGPTAQVEEQSKKKRVGEPTDEDVAAAQKFLLDRYGLSSKSRIVFVLRGLPQVSARKYYLRVFLCAGRNPAHCTWPVAISKVLTAEQVDQTVLEFDLSKMSRNRWVSLADMATHQQGLVIRTAIVQDISFRFDPTLGSLPTTVKPDLENGFGTLAFTEVTLEMQILK